MYTKTKLMEIEKKIPKNHYTLKQWAKGILRRYDSLDSECAEFASAISEALDKIERAQSGPLGTQCKDLLGHQEISIKDKRI